MMVYTYLAADIENLTLRNYHKEKMVRYLQATTHEDNQFLRDCGIESVQFMASPKPGEISVRIKV
jgi:hypothetical protein